MSTLAAPPNPCLLAILLVIQARTGAGAQVVFHYPPNPLSEDQLDTRQQDPEAAHEGQSSSSDSDESSSSDDNDFEIFTERASKNAHTSNGDYSHLTDDDDDYRTKKEQVQGDMGWRPPWEPLLGLGEESLVSLLAPGRAWHKRRFEMAINDLSFIGRPVYAKESGSWQRRKHKKTRDKIQEDLEFPSESGTESEHEDSYGDKQQHKTAARKLETHEQPRSPLTMFNIVFVMDPPPLEQTFRVKEMYDNIVKKFSKVLKFVQIHDDYVWQQSEIIQNVKSVHYSRRSTTATLYSELVRQSSLATAISTIYKAISTSRIAAVTLTPKVSVSLQIPPITSTPYLPSLTDPPIQPGLWLTTANESPSTTSELDTASASGALHLAKNLTLLLRASPHKILKDIQATGGPLALPLANLIEKGRPTKSFYKTSVESHISLTDIQLLARHLIYWRRAIAIPPLHQRDTYIVSPNADMSKLMEATKSFEVMFPMMPSLPKILNLLSGTPMPFGTIIPSTDHKEEYYRVLAALMRGGWVTQLRTFAFVRVDPSIKKAVRDEEMEEKLQRTRSDLEGMGVPGIQISPSTRPSMVSRPSSDGRQSIDTGRDLTTNPKAASLIMSPLRASATESRWLAHIAGSLLTENYTADEDLSETEKAELKKYWSVFVKYFNGAEALEKIPVREGLKRKFVRDLLGRMGLDFDRGVQDEQGANKSILVAIQHW